MVYWLMSLNLRSLVAGSILGQFQFLLQLANRRHSRLETYEKYHDPFLIGSATIFVAIFFKISKILIIIVNFTIFVFVYLIQSRYISVCIYTYHFYFGILPGWHGVVVITASSWLLDRRFETRTIPSSFL